MYFGLGGLELNMPLRSLELVGAYPQQENLQQEEEPRIGLTYRGSKTMLLSFHKLLHEEK